MAWVVHFSPEAEQWLASLPDEQFDSVIAAVEMLEVDGPALGRPAVDLVKGSRHSNMKELRSFGGHLRALFAFDPKRQAIVLLGGDKAGNWTGWYERNIPIADDLFDDYLNYLETQKG
ncbi:MAG: type II toxin-antitoxin system RelE/ParE family toxin [Patulibacter sp.]